MRYFFKTTPKILFLLATWLLTCFFSLQIAGAAQIDWYFTGLYHRNIKSITIDFNDSIIYAGTEQGLYRTLDYGRKWEYSNDVQIDTFCLGADPKNHKIIYAGTVKGLYKSSDDGWSWAHLSNTSTYKISVSPTNPKVIYTLTNGGILKSTDGGASWTNLSEGKIDSAINFIAVDPSSDLVSFAATKAGVLKSTDGGASWTNLMSASFSCLAIDPSNHNIIYAGTTGGIVFKTSDGGGKWISSGSGLPSSAIDSLQISPLNRLTIFAGTQQGIYRSRDGGGKWEDFSDGLTNKNIYALAADAGNRTFFAGTQKGIFQYIEIDPPKRVDVVPSKPLSINMPSGNLNVGIPAGTCAARMKMTITQKVIFYQSGQGLAPLSSYDFTLKNAANGTSISSLKKDVALTFHYTPAMLKKNRAPKSALWIFYSGKASSKANRKSVALKWTPLKSLVFDRKKNKVVCRVRHFSQYALMADVVKPKLSTVDFFGKGSKITAIVKAFDQGVGIGSVYFFLDGKLIGKDIRAPYSFTFSTKGMKPGHHRIKITAYDKVKNSSSMTTGFNLYK